MDEKIQALAHELMANGVAELTDREKRIIARIAARRHDNREAEVGDEPATLGERVADAVARWGGSWTFIGAFAAFLAVWALINALLLPERDRFDPYPFIFLNLMLSMLAAIQAPIIMMSQNRQASRDRRQVIRDYEVNLKAETEICELDTKVDRLMAEVRAMKAAKVKA